MRQKRALPLGYRYESTQITVDKAGSAILETVFAQYISHASLREIALWLTEQGIPMREDRPAWDKNAVRRMLLDTRYLGEKGFPPLISKELFEQAANTIQARNVTVSKNPVMAGIAKKTYCSVCGARIHRKSTNLKYVDWFCPAEYTAGHRRLDDDGVAVQIASRLDWIRKNPECLQSTASPESTSVPIRSAPALPRSASPAQFQDAVLRAAEQRFAALPDAQAPESRALVRRFQEITEEIKAPDMALMEDTVQRVLLDADGTIHLELINRKVI